MKDLKIQFSIIAVTIFTSGLSNSTRTLKISIAKSLDIVFGFHGNCTTTHFVQFRWNGMPKTNITTNNPTFKSNPALASLTYRSPAGTETVAYLRARWRFIDFNSEHIATRYGKLTEASFGSYYSYDGPLGHHVAM